MRSITSCQFVLTWLSWTLLALGFGYDYEMKVSNDGPAVLDSNITFTAEVTDAPSYLKLLYVFRHDVPGEGPKEHEVSNGTLAKLELIFGSSDHRSGVYNMRVDAYQMHFLTRQKVASGSTHFRLSRDIVGKIVLSQGGRTLPDDQTFLSTNETAEFTFQLHDPGGYFGNASNSLSWKLDHGFSHYAPSLRYNFTDTNRHVVTLVVVALVSRPESTSPVVKIGSFSREVTPMDPITAVNVTGNVWLRRGDVVSLQVTCNGSSPYSYCWKYFPGNTTSHDTANLTCDEPVTTNICRFPLVHYFAQDGAYLIAIVISNMVQEKPYVKNIEAHIYDVSRRRQLSTVLLPVVCSLLALGIMAAGAGYHLKTRHRLRVEVADFDFRLSSDSLAGGGFFDRIVREIEASRVDERRTVQGTWRSYGAVA